MKITDKTLMINFETEVKLGNNDAIELTLLHQAYLSERENGTIGVDLDLSVDYTDIKFLGIEIENNHTAFNQFRTQLKEFGIDLNMLIKEKEQELIDDGLVEKLKLMFRNKF